MTDQDDQEQHADDDAPPLPDELQSEADALLAEIDFTPDAGPGAGPGAAAADSVGIPTGEMLTQFFDLAFNNVIAPRRGDHWKMSSAESEALGVASGAVVDKYFPDLSAGPEVTLALVVVAVFGPRIVQDYADQSVTKADAETAGDAEPAAPAEVIEPDFYAQTPEEIIDTKRTPRSE